MLPPLCANIFYVFPMMDNLDACLIAAQTTFFTAASSTGYRVGFQVQFQPSKHKMNVNLGLYHWHKATNPRVKKVTLRSATSRSTYHCMWIYKTNVGLKHPRHLTVERHFVLVVK
jgi:hypothetical protein